MTNERSATVQDEGSVEPEPSENPAPRRWLVVTFLLVVAILNLVDRFLPAILLEPMKADLRLSDVTLGMINGVGFLILYAAASIPIARLSDRGLYGSVIAVCVGFWSFMTTLGGLAQSGWQLAATRMGVALGEAGSMPAAHAYISRNFAPQHRTAPLALLTMYGPFGTSLALFGGGVMGEVLGWRMTFVLIGLLGLALTPVSLLVVRNAPKASLALNQATSSKPPPITPYFKRSALAAILTGTAMIGVSGYSTTLFAPAFLMRSYDMSVSEVGVGYGLLNGAFGVAGLVVVGAVADRLSSKDARWLLGVVVATLACTLPFTAGAYLVSDPRLAMIGVSIGSIAQTAYLAPVIAAAHRLVPPNARATASAILLSFSAIVGSLGPVLTGWLSDILQPELGDLSLARALLMIVPTTQLIGGICFLIAALRFSRQILPETGAEY